VVEADGDDHAVAGSAGVLSGAASVRWDEHIAGAAAAHYDVEVATLGLPGGVVDPYPGRASTASVLNAEQPCLILVGGAAATAQAMAGVVLTCHGVAGGSPGSVLNGQPGLKDARALNDGEDHQQ